MSLSHKAQVAAGRINHYKFVGGGQFRGGQQKESTCKCDEYKAKLRAKEQWYSEMLDQHRLELAQLQEERNQDQKAPCIVPSFQPDAP